MTTTMNTGAAPQQGTFDGDSEETRKAFREYDAEYPVTHRSHWQIWRDAIAYAHKTALATPTPQADAAPIINGHAVNDLFLKWSEWTTELGEAISRKNIDGFVSELRAAIAAGGAQETAAARDVLAERQRQVNAEGWTAEHDDEHDSEEMAIAAACYAESAAGFHHPATGVPHTWPWTNRWWKPTTPRRDLVKAGALILAEIERLDRATASNGEQA